MLMCMGFRLLHLNFLIVILMIGLLRMVGLIILFWLVLLELVSV